MENEILNRWNTIIQAQISLLWISETLKPENQDKTVKELLNNFIIRNESVLPINIGTLMMASYILFLYPREVEFINIDLKNIDATKFNIIVKGNPNNNENDNQYLIRRIRNSLAHGKFQINDNNIITFMDDDKGNNSFKVEILFVDLGNFIQDFMFNIKNQVFKKK